MNADTDLLNLAGMLGHLDSPCLERLFIEIHMLPPGKADKDIVGVTTLAGLGPLRSLSFRMKLACMCIDGVIWQGWC